MKKSFTILAAIILTVNVFAQSPEKMSYQAVIRNSSDVLVTDTQVGMQISILQGDIYGAALYVETQTPNTNANGLVSIEIGDGTVLNGDFSLIDWANGPYYIKTETDPAGSTNYTITGVSQLLSVPYALHAKSAESVTGEITESDPVFSGSQANKITGTDITNLSNLSGSNTGDQDLSTLATNTALGDSVAQVRSEMPVVPTGTQAGEMQYWNGMAWVTVATTENEGAVLQMIGGVPTWVGGNTNKKNQLIFDGTTYELVSGHIYDDDTGPDLYEIEASLDIAGNVDGFPVFEFEGWSSSANINGTYSLENSMNPMTMYCNFRLTRPDQNTDGIYYPIINGTFSIYLEGTIYEIIISGYDKDGLKCDLYYKGELGQWD